MKPVTYIWESDGIPRITRFADEAVQSEYQKTIVGLTHFGRAVRCDDSEPIESQYERYIVRRAMILRDEAAEAEARVLKLRRDALHLENCPMPRVRDVP